MMSSNYYEILGLDLNELSRLSIEEVESKIKSNYRKLARKWHPDANLGNERVAEAKFKDIQEAYDTLGDPAKRRKYDLLGSPYDSSRTTATGPAAGDFVSNFAGFSHDQFNFAFEAMLFHMAHGRDMTHKEIAERQRQEQLRQARIENDRIERWIKDVGKVYGFASNELSYEGKEADKELADRLSRRPELVDRCLGKIPTERLVLSTNLFNKLCEIKPDIVLQNCLRDIQPQDLIRSENIFDRLYAINPDAVTLGCLHNILPKELSGSINAFNKFYKNRPHAVIVKMQAYLVSEDSVSETDDINLSTLLAGKPTIAPQHIKDISTKRLAQTPHQHRDENKRYNARLKLQRALYAKNPGLFIEKMVAHYTGQFQQTPNGERPYRGDAKSSIDFWYDDNFHTRGGEAGFWLSRFLADDPTVADKYTQNIPAEKLAYTNLEKELLPLCPDALVDKMLPHYLEIIKKCNNEEYEQKIKYPASNYPVSKVSLKAQNMLVEFAQHSTDVAAKVRDAVRAARLSLTPENRDTIKRLAPPLPPNPAQVAFANIAKKFKFGG